MPENQAGDTLPATIPEMITNVARSVMMDLAIPGDLTDDVLTFALDISRDDFFPDDFLPQLLAYPQSAAFCRATAARLFALLRSDPIERTFEYVPGSTLSPTERERQVFRHSQELARDVGVAIAAGTGVVWKVKYCNHEFILTVMRGRLDLFQSFQGPDGFGVGTSVDHTKSVAAGEIEWCLKTMADAEGRAIDAHKIAFGQVLSPRLAEVFAFEKAPLASDLEIASRLRERMFAGLAYYKELTQRFSVPPQG